MGGYPIESFHPLNTSTEVHVLVPSDAFVGEWRYEPLSENVKAALSGVSGWDS